MNRTKIEWCDYTWNPVNGCTPVSDGCANCYAKRIAKRFNGDFSVKLHPERLEEPIGLKKPSKIFVCSMGDLFYENIHAGFIVDIFDVMQVAAQHTFFVLTKRPERIKPVLFGEEGRWYLGGGDYLPNVWIGTSVEDQKTADKRIPKLFSCGWKGRIFVSVEPMLGPVDLTQIRNGRIDALAGDQKTDAGEIYAGGQGLDWVICGAETGPGARPIKEEWVELLRQQCSAASVPFLFKKWNDPARDKSIPDSWREFPECRR